MSGEWFTRGIRRAFVAVAAATLLATPAFASGLDAPPADFLNKDAVLGSVDRMTEACAKAGANDCKTACETSKRLTSSHLSRTKPNVVAVENTWKQCQRAYVASLATPPAAVDYAKMSINGFVLHSDLRQQQNRFEMLEARGFSKSHKSESTVRLRFKGQPEAGAKEPDIVLHYNGIVEQGGFTQIEGTGDGRIIRIRHVVKGAVDPAKARADISQRYGPPHKTQGDALMWGCEKNNHEGCFIAEIMPHQIEYRAIDDSIKSAWGAKYGDMVRKAR